MHSAGREQQPNAIQNRNHRDNRKEALQIFHYFLFLLPPGPSTRGPPTGRQSVVIQPYGVGRGNARLLYTVFLINFRVSSANDLAHQHDRLAPDQAGQSAQPAQDPLAAKRREFAGKAQRQALPLDRERRPRQHARHRRRNDIGEP